MGSNVCKHIPGQYRNLQAEYIEGEVLKTDISYSDRELKRAYLCLLTNKPCVARKLIQKEEPGFEDFHYIELDPGIAERCPLYCTNLHQIISPEELKSIKK